MTKTPLKPPRIKQRHEVLTRDGKTINWHRPPKPNTICRWSKRDTNGRVIYGTFRTLCHLNRLNNLSVARFGVEIQVIQRDYNSTVAASKGTHDFDAVFDLWIPGVDPWRQQRFFRANGFWTWYRHPPLFGNHQHGFSIPEAEGKVVSDNFREQGNKVGIYVDGGYSTVGHLVTSSQIADAYNGAFGLAGQHSAGSDKSWRPKSINATIFQLKPYVARRARLQAA